MPGRQTVPQVGARVAARACRRRVPASILCFALLLSGQLAVSASPATAVVPPRPTVTGIAPNIGVVGGGTAVTLTGTGFRVGDGVAIGGAAATSVVVISDTSMTATTARHAAGAVDVVVADGGATGTCAACFTYDDPRQNGDLFVGSASYVDGYGNTAGGLWRVRGSVAMLFCSSPLSSFDSGFWDSPDTVIVDSRGRVVFLAAIGFQEIGLLRCDQPGQPAERLGAFRVRQNIPAGWPEPFPDTRFGVRMGSLHILAQRVITDDLQSLPKVNNEDSYEFVAQLQSTPGDPTVPGPTELVRYGADTGTWQQGRDLPDILQSGNLVSVIAHGGDLWSLNGSTLRRTSLPYNLTVSGTAGGLDYKLTLQPFGSVHELGNAITDDTNVPNVSSGCNTDPPGKHDDVTDGMPYNNGFAPLSAERVIYDEHGDLGLVLRTNYGPMPGPYMTHVSSALLNDDVNDDSQGYFHQAFDSCRHVPWIQFSSIMPRTSTGSTVAFDNVADVIATAPGGMVGTSFWGNRILRLTPGDKASQIATLYHPGGIAAYPAIVPSIGTVIYITVHSPVDVLLTDAAGRRIGVDPTTGTAVNDFAAGGFDSGPGEPRVFAIKNPSPGAFTLSSTGTGTGPYQIDIASADLVTAATARVTTTGNATPGAKAQHDFTLAATGGLAFAHPVVTTPPTVTPQVSGTAGANGWYLSNVAVTWGIADGGSVITSTGGCVPTTIVADTTGRTLTCAATNAGGTTTSTVTVQRDATAPAISGARSPAPNASGWNAGDITASFTCVDGTSGIASCSPPVTVTTEGAGQNATGTAIDRAGNSTAVTVGGLNIDKTAPTTAATPDRAPNANGWNNVPVKISLACADALAGCGVTSYRVDGAAWTPYANAISITTEGVHTLQYRSTDRADNTEAVQTLTVRLDFTPPDAVVRFDPTALDLVVLPRDPADTVELISSTPATTGGRDGEDENDSRGGELRSYLVRDHADNTLVLVVAVKREGDEVKAAVVSQQLNGGPVISAPPNRIAIEWSLARDHSIRKLLQRFSTGRQRDLHQVTAEYGAERNITTIRSRTSHTEDVGTRSGLALIRLEVVGGGILIAFD